MSRPLAFPRPLAWDHDYWLCRCQGFCVDSPAGRIGRIAEVRFGSRLDRPDTLVIQTGLLKRRLTVAVSEVDKVVPTQERLLLRSSPKHIRTERWFDR